MRRWKVNETNSHKLLDYIDDKRLDDADYIHTSTVMSMCKCLRKIYVQNFGKEFAAGKIISIKTKFEFCE